MVIERKVLLLFQFEGARSYFMAQKGPKRPKMSKYVVWLVKTGGTVWNELATSQSDALEPFH